MENILKKFLEDKDIRPSHFARKAGISKQLLHVHLKNPKMPWSSKNAGKIVEATDGELNIIDLLIP